MRLPRQENTFALRALAAAALIALALPAGAQLSSASVRGAVTAGAAAAPNATVSATNLATGQVLRTTSRADGSYVLNGLQPGNYRIDITAAGQAGQSQQLTVQVGQVIALDLSVGAAGSSANTTQLGTVLVQGSALVDRKNSELGTNVTTRQIEALPQNSRNFLAFADLAPGVRFETEPNGMVRIQSGAQNQDNVNVFIDGVSQKNYILRGGIAGMDATRGNPFPQSAIAEYKVISQNYKAEFDQVSAAAITAVTKSGGNTLAGEVFWDHTGSNLTAYNPSEKANRANGNDRAKFTQDQYGASIGGPIKQDVAHFFISYEGKNIQQPRNVGFASVANLLPNAGLVPGFFALQGSHNQEFKEHLLFGKLDAVISANQRAELSMRLRREDDFVPEDINLSAPGNDKNRKNDETRLDFKHEWSNDAWLNEARFGYENYTYNPHSASTDPQIKYLISPINDKRDVRAFLITGGSPDAQHREQKGWLLQDDLSYTGLAGHSIKGGAKFKAVKVELSGTARSVDMIEKLIDNQTGLPIVGLFEGNPAADYIKFDPALPAVPVSYKNNMFGIYLQDDWQLTKQLELNLGVRWDYESNMLNNNYATPADRVAIFGAQDPRAGAAPGQTYAQSLAKGGVNINDYISTGKRRSFKNAIAPRLGFSYDLKGDKQTVLFGGLGRSYDRTIANHALDELQKNQVPGGEIWMIRSDYKMPFSDQISLGLRQGLGEWNGEVGASYVHAKNQFNWYGGNRDVNGGWGTQSPIDPLWGSVPGFGTLVLGDFISQAKTQMVYVKADKPYSRSSGWGVNLTYTYSEGKTTNKEWTNDIFNWTYGKSIAGWNPSKDVEKHRIVASAVTDGLLPYGILLSGKLTLGSGLPRRITDCSKGFNDCVSVEGDGKAFRQVDVGVGKEFKIGWGRVAFRMDVLNLFNAVNQRGFDDWGGGPGNPQNYLGGDNPNLGLVNSYYFPRTVKLSARYVF
jgi:hypothetical protein